MSFYLHNPEMGLFLEELIERFEKESRPGLQTNISITWICYKDQNPEQLSGLGAGWLEEKLVYPASVVKLFYACAIEAWLEQDLISDCAELRRALAEMIINSNNDATSLIVDLLTGTTSGPALHGTRWDVWKKQRNLINVWLHALHSEFRGINCCQKTWTDGPFGRDYIFYGRNNQNRNALTTLATAKLFEDLMTGNLISAKSSKNLKKLLFRSLDLSERKLDPNNQIDGFLGEGLPKGTKLWSKAGFMSEVRHDAAWFVTPKGQTMLLVIFTTDKMLVKDTFLLPAFANELSKWSFIEKDPSV